MRRLRELMRMLVARQIPRIYLHGPRWKKQGYKGRVEVWGMDGKFKSAHKTVQEALDSIPSIKPQAKVQEEKDD